VFTGDDGRGLLVTRFVGFGLSGPRTTAIAFSTNVRAADLADAEELIIAIPKAIVTNAINLNVLRFLEVDWADIEVEIEFMGALLWLE
jgi:hypothetical protein